MNAKSLPIFTTCLIFFLIFPSATQASIETFADETDGATSFSMDGGTFSLTSFLTVEEFSPFGSGGDARYIDSGFGQSRSGSVGTIAVSGAMVSFQLVTLDAWTSNDGGNNFASGITVTFTGTRLIGGTISEAIVVTPTGNTGLDWDETLSFSSGIWSGVDLVSLDISIGAGADFIALDDVNFTSVTLPVDLSYFKSLLREAEVELEWATTSEINNAGFEVQRSTEGQAFEAIGFVEGNGFSSSLNIYHFIDRQLQFSQEYTYRLKQIDFDGQFEYSPTLTARLEGGQVLVGEFYPNPSLGQLYLPLQGKENSKIAMRIFNSAGIEVHNINLQALDRNQFEMDLSHFSPGIYVAKIWFDGVHQIRRFQKN